MATAPDYEAALPKMSNNTWLANSNFKYSTLSGVYKVAGQNLDSIFIPYEEMKVLKINEDDLLQVIKDGENPDNIIHDIQGPAAYMGVWLCLGLIFSLVGMIWCCCNKCCCCCPSKTSPGKPNLEDPTHEGARKGGKTIICKVLIAILMGLWIIGFSFGLFIAFSSNESLRKSIYEFYDDFDHSLHDTEAYLNTTRKQLRVTFITNYDTLSERIKNIVDTQMFGVIKLLDEGDTLLNEIDYIKNHVSDKTQLNGLSDTLENLKGVISKDVTPLFQKIHKQNDPIKDIGDTVEKVGKDLEANAKVMFEAIDEIPIRDIRNKIHQIEEEYLDVVGSSVYGGFMAFNVVHLMILIGIVMGFSLTLLSLFCDGKGGLQTGFIFYRFSIVSMFIIGLIVTLVMVTLFFFAGLFSQVNCEAVRSLEQREHQETVYPPDCPAVKANHFQLIKPNFKIGDYEVPNYSFIVSSCRKKKSAYVSLKLSQVYDISTICNISEEFKAKFKVLSTDNANENAKEKEFASVYSKLEKELISLQNFKDFILKMNPQIKSLQKLYSSVESSTISVLKDLKPTEPGSISPHDAKDKQKQMDIIKEVEIYENFVYTVMIKTVGQCEPMYNALNGTIHAICYKFIAPIATYWWGLQFLLIMFGCVIVTALTSERIF